MSFAVVRHPDIEPLGVIPHGVLEGHRARGWVRVSDWRETNDFHLPDFEDSFVDLDAPEPELDEQPAEPEKEQES